MVIKTITLPLGGADRTLMFGAMGFFTHVKEATKQDPFEWLAKFDNGSNDLTVLIEDVAVLAYAGINTNLDCRDEPNIPFEKVRKWCNGLEVETMTEIFKTSLSSFTTEKTGELTPNQENGVKKEVAA